jgi:peptidoglycan/LPS O-acetylase OafA/YrhL
MLQQYSPFIALIIFGIAFYATYVFNKIFNVKIPSGRYENIDGLRGFLAISVFMHHSSIWYQYFETGEWATPKSNLYAELGDTSVAFFFMITSFLFVSKILNIKSNLIHWPSFFTTRFFRLAPLFYSSLAIIIFLVYFKTYFQIQDSFLHTIKNIGQWVLFTIYDNPEINNYKFTNLVNAGVMWSLTYEWLFYFSLPIISLSMLFVKSNFKYYIIAIVFVLLFFKFGVFSLKIIFPFLAGAIAPLLKYYNYKIKNINSKYISVIIIVAFVCLLPFRKYVVLYILLYSLIFTLIALGNNLFGILHNKTLRIMGEISYSTYLLHGIVLFIAINAFYGNTEMRKLDATEYYVYIFWLTPIVIFVSLCGYTFIEKPFITFGKKLTVK